MKIYIATLGCKLNQFESRALTENLTENGFEIVSKIEEADVTLVNSCTVTSKADTKSRAVMKRAKKLGQRVVALGCLATTDGEKLLNASFVDAVLGNEEKLRVANLLSEWKNAGQCTVFDDEFPEVADFEKTRAVLKIQDGCNKYCSYCKIPFARGNPRSVSLQKAEEMARSILSRGFHELVLTGINISSYDDDGRGLFELCERLLKLDFDFRLRLSSLQPDELDRRILSLLSHPKFCSQLHLSLQSGSSGVLKRMNRRYDRDFFLHLVEEIRGISPDCAVTTDIINGFPDESEDEFSETVDLIRQAGFSRVHLFNYSRREGTKAAKMEDLPMPLKKKREKILRAEIRSAALSFAKKHWLGKVQSVLFESPSSGYSSEYARVHLHTKDALENQMLEVKILSADYSEDYGIELFAEKGE